MRSGPARPLDGCIIVRPGGECQAALGNASLRIARRSRHSQPRCWPGLIGSKGLCPPTERGRIKSRRDASGNSIIADARALWYNQTYPWRYI